VVWGSRVCPFLLWTARPPGFSQIALGATTLSVGAVDDNPHSSRVNVAALRTARAVVASFTGITT
jgi:hypothetical protein